MTSRALRNLNRRIDMLARNLRGDPAYKIAEHYEITHQAVSRILQLARKDSRTMRAANELLALRDLMREEKPTRQERARAILDGAE